MKRKNVLRVLSLVLILAVSVGFFPEVRIARAEQVYTVILSPGEGTGENIVYRSNEGEIAPTWRDAKEYQFYYEDNQGLGFRASLDRCPDSFTPPSGCVFRGWNPNSGYITLSSAETTLTAKWGSDSEIEGMLPCSEGGESYTLGGYTWTVIGSSFEKYLLILQDMISVGIEWDKAAEYCEEIYTARVNTTLYI